MKEIKKVPEEDISAFLIYHGNKYPKAEIADFIKLLYQASHGGGHMVQNREASLCRLKEEIAGIPEEQNSGPVIEDLCGEYCRLHLSNVPDAAVDAINQIFIVSNEAVPEKAEERLKESLTVFLRLCREGELPFAYAEAERQVSAYAAEGYPVAGHSEAYRRAYRPAYRVVQKKYVRFLDLFIRIQQLLDRQDTVSVAIDGNSGAGKSSLAGLIADLFDCHVFHADDFFLPPALRTEKRLNEVGGNMDYKRFEEEICQNVKKGKDFTYNIFDCSVMRMNGEVHVTPKKLNVFEGSYTQHPSLQKYSDIKVFLSIDPAVQEARILRRNGEAMLLRFLDEWIPKENRYFSEMRIPEQADFVYNENEEMSAF